MSSIYIITGEVSGDLHAANWLKKERIQNPNVFVFAMGGEQLQKAGAEMRFDFKEIAIMGFWEVLKKASFLKKYIQNVADDILEKNPDKLLLVDSSGFNLRLAKIIKSKSNIPVHYYIAPKIWAWGEWRIKKIKKYIDFLHCILPFEEEYFKSKGFKNATYVGNPTLEEINAHVFENISIPLDAKDSVLALLPGSRMQEIEKMLPVMLAAAQNSNYTKIIIARSSNIPISYFDKFYKNSKNVFLLTGETWNLLKTADAALVTSGTATLETALIGCPQVVLYKTSPISYALAKKLIKIKYISLVNLILNRLAVDELIQEGANFAAVQNALGMLEEGNAEGIKRELILKLKS